MKMVGIEDLEIECRWDQRFDDEFVLTFEDLMMCDDMMKQMMWQRDGVRSVLVDLSDLTSPIPCPILFLTYSLPYP